MDSVPHEKDLTLLPQSGIGVDGPFLVIAPAGHPTIRLDVRLLDYVGLERQSPKTAYAASLAAAGGVVAGAMSWVPGGLFLAAGMAYVAQERFFRARDLVNSRDLLLVLDRLKISLQVSDGAQAAKSVAERLSQYTRMAPITRPEVYQDARRRLNLGAQGGQEPAWDANHGLHVGGDMVTVADGVLQVGRARFRVQEVRDYARRGANLPLPNGRLLQAALGLLIVAAYERSRQGDNLKELSLRVAEYEAWTGRFGGR